MLVGKLNPVMSFSEKYSMGIGEWETFLSSLKNCKGKKYGLERRTVITRFELSDQ
jgi:hypothetical protein